jgi:site-specific DNA-methyltransferase (adenine-specific)
MELNKIYNEDNAVGMKRIDDGSVDVILTDPPYLYLKNQKLDRPFDEAAFFDEVKRVLKKNGFIVLFGRGTSFYRWNTILADLGFVFKEEIVWDKGRNTSPLMNISRVHETCSVFTKGKGTINKVKIPYMEMKGRDIDSIITDIKRLKAALKNTKSLDAVLSFLENNRRDISNSIEANNLSISSQITNENRCVASMRSIAVGMNEKSIIRTDRYYTERCAKSGVNCGATRSGDRTTDVMQSIAFGLNEKTIIKQSSDRYNAVHPTQKPARLLERLLALVSKEGDLILDPFSGSASTAIAAHNTGRNFIGFEIDREFYEAGVRRLNKALNTPKVLELFTDTNKTV